VIFAKCGDADRARFSGSSHRSDCRRSLAAGGETTSFSFSYETDGTRVMNVDAVGEPFRTDEPPGSLLRGVDWLYVAPLCAAISTRRRSSGSASAGG